MTVLHTLRTYRELFVVLATTLAALFVWQNFAPDVHAFTGDGSAAEEVVDPALLAALDEPLDPVACLDAAPSASAVPRPPPGKERMLILGDSMVEVLSPELHAYAKVNGHELVPAIWYGSTTAAWAGGPELGRLLKEIDPTMVIVVLGSSELTRRSIATRRPYIEAIARRVGARKLAWIGPPNWREDTGINDLVADVVGRDRFFLSEGLELSRKKDGIHPDTAGGHVWVSAFVSWLATESRFGLEMVQPSSDGPFTAPAARVLGRM